MASGSPVQPIEIVMRDDFAVLSGTVWLDGRRTQGTVLVIPELAPRGAKMVFTDPTGAFQIGTLPPGEYRVLAFDRIDDLEYTNPEATRNYVSGARTVRLWPNQETTVNLELQKRGD